MAGVLSETGGTGLMLTICYITARRDNRIEWFFQSLARQATLATRVLVVDHFADEPGRKDETFEKFFRAFGEDSECWMKHVSPKPNVWNGPHRLTKDEWFAAASMRNTAICLCQTRYIAFVDDLSVLMPGWFNAVHEAVHDGYVGLGAYKKVQDLTVGADGVRFRETESGMDDRLRRVSQDVSPCDGGWLYGCSLVAPLEDLLEVGGFPEICDGLGSEDYCLGIALRNAGKHLKFDRRMLTLESEELHFVEKPFKRTDKGVSPNDKSHAALRIAQASTYFPNYFPEGGIRRMRDDVLLDGEPFPITQVPDRDWFDGQLLSEM